MNTKKQKLRARTTPLALVQKNTQTVFKTLSGSKYLIRIPVKVAADNLGKRTQIFLACLIIALILVSQVANQFNQKSAVLSSSISQEPAQSHWCDDCRVMNITMPTILFADKTIAQMHYDEKQKTWPTPITGIATPEETVKNNIVVFGHSKWSSKMNHFARISLLNVGDSIYITDQFGQTYRFAVTKAELFDRLNGDPVHRKDGLQLTLLTTARFNGEWLLPSDLPVGAIDHVGDKNKYAVLVITAKPAASVR